MSSRVIALVVAVAAALPAAASADVTRHDVGGGRTVAVDMRVEGVPAARYAAIIARAVHGDEVRRVTIRVIPAKDVARRCGRREAAGCYSGNGRRGVMTVPAGPRAEVAHTVLHEYGHHVDAAIRGPIGAGDGTPRWWRARGMANRLTAGEIAPGYERGWSRTIAEIFAEDYVQLNLRAPYGIEWLRPPSGPVLAAIRRDIVGRAGPREGAPTGRTWRRAGQRAPGVDSAIPFETAGPGRHINAEIVVDGGVVHATLRCAGRVMQRAVGASSRPARIARGRLPVGACEIQLVNAGNRTATLGATLRLRRPA